MNFLIMEEFFRFVVFRESQNSLLFFSSSKVLGKQGHQTLALLDYFHMSEQHPLFFLGSPSKLTFSAFKGCCNEAPDLTALISAFLPLIPFW